MAVTLHRVQMLLEPEQHTILAELAKAQGRSMASVTREVIAVGLAHLGDQDTFARRAQAIRRADALATRIEARAGGRLEIDVARDLNELREERDEQIASSC